MIVFLSFVVGAEDHADGTIAFNPICDRERV